MEYNLKVDILLNLLSSYNLYHKINLQVRTSPLLRYWLQAKWPSHADILSTLPDSDNSFGATRTEPNQVRMLTMLLPIKQFGGSSLQERKTNKKEESGA